VSTKIATVKLTKNFEANLESIEAFWNENEFPQGYDRLLDDLTAILIPNLERFPQMGHAFIDRQPQSVEALSKHEQLRAKLARLAKDAEIREYVLDDYLLLYAWVKSDVYLLSIRHHKQLSFDFAHLWR
jgi:hypothetical protein